MKRLLVAIVDAITELTEVIRFGIEDVAGHFDDMETMLYMQATTHDRDVEEELAWEYQDGFDDGYALARSIFWVDDTANSTPVDDDFVLEEEDDF